MTQYNRVCQVLEKQEQLVDEAIKFCIDTKNHNYATKLIEDYKVDNKMTSSFKESQSKSYS